MHSPEVNKQSQLTCKQSDQPRTIHRHARHGRDSNIFLLNSVFLFWFFLALNEIRDNKTIKQPTTPRSTFYTDEKKR